MNTMSLKCPQCDSGPEQLWDDPDHGQLVCTSCGTVIGDSLLYGGDDHGVYQGTPRDRVGPSTAVRVRHLQGALRDSLRPTPTQTGEAGPHPSTNQSQQAKCKLALQDLDSYARLLNIPDGDWPELHRLYLFVMRGGRFRWGSSAGFVAAACVVLLSRKLQAPVPLHTACTKLHMDVYTLGQYLGQVRLLAARFFVVGELGEMDNGRSDYDDAFGNIDVKEYAHIPAILAILSPGSSEEQLLSLARSMLDDMMLSAPPDRSTLLQAWQQAAARGDVTSLRHFSPLDPSSGNHTRARLYLPTILRMVSHLFESCRPQACALALACIAREAQEAIPCSAALWASLLGACNSGTALLHQRDATEAIMDAAKPLPWFKEIKVRGTGRNTEQFLGQILDLVDVGVLQVGGGEAPSYRRGRHEREELEVRVRRAMTKLRRLGAEVRSDVYLEEHEAERNEECDDGADAPNTSMDSTACLKLIVTDVDVAIESLLVHGAIPVSQVLSMTSRDILVAADLLAQEQQRYERRDLEASDLGEHDLTMAEQQIYIPYVAQSHLPESTGERDGGSRIPEQLMMRAHILESIARRPR